MWGISVALFGLFIAAVSVETLSALGGIEVPLVSTLGEVGASLYVSAVGLSVFLTIFTHIATSFIDMRDVNGNGVPDDPVTIGRRQGQPAMTLADEGPAVPKLEAAEVEDAPARRIGEDVGGTVSGQSSPDSPKSRWG